MSSTPPPPSATPGSSAAGRWPPRWESPPGPVHLNLPFREPLEPAAGARARDATRLPALPPRPRIAPDPPTIDRVAGWIEEAERGVIVCGPIADPRGRAETGAALEALARAARFPLLADALSPVRPGGTGDPVALDRYDAILRDRELAGRLAPDVVVRFGDTPTSKAVRLWLDRHRACRQILVDPDDAWQDPIHGCDEVLRADPAATARALAERLEPGGAGWLPTLVEADERAGRAIGDAVEAEAELVEPRVVRELGSRLGDRARRCGEPGTLFVSSSLPVRDVDGFLRPLPSGLRVIGQRGANGIDGVTSAALGVAATLEGPVALLTGDLAFLHDLGGLLAARRHGIGLAIVVIHNDGGGSSTTCRSPGRARRSATRSGSPPRTVSSWVGRPRCSTSSTSGSSRSTGSAPPWSERSSRRAGAGRRSSRSGSTGPGASPITGTWAAGAGAARRALDGVAAVEQAS